MVIQLYIIQQRPMLKNKTKRSCLVLIVILASLISSLNAYAKDATFGDFLTSYFDHIGSDIPGSYKYIQLYFKNLNPSTDLYTNLQKAVYLDMIQNKAISIEPTQPISYDMIATVVQKHFGDQVKITGSGTVSDEDLIKIIEWLPSYKQYYCGNKQYISIDLWDYTITKDKKFPIFNDVYEKLKKEYIYSDKLGPNQLMYWALKGMIESTEDPYTVFFPPQESEEFYGMFDQSYEWIGALIEKTDEWIQIISPFEWSPAEKAGLKPGDIIISVDGTSVIDMSDKDAVKLIKGPANSSVTLIIKRDTETITYKIRRESINLEHIKTKNLDLKNYYIDIDVFADDIVGKMANAIQEYNKSTATKLIIDLRNNPWWLLDVANELLWFFLPDDSNTFTIKSNNDITPYKAPQQSVKVKKSTIVLLVNEGSASASEILAQVLRDNWLAILVWKQTFWKWSGQTVYDYTAGESFKLTNFKRYSTKTMESIDKVGLKPDFEVEQSVEDTMSDKQLEYAKSL